MRALGPGSVSSFLKIVLDVVHVALSIALGVVATLAVAAPFIHIDPRIFGASADLPPTDIEAARRIAMALLLAGTIYIACVLIIVGRLRRIFATLTAGDPFEPDNVRRLRIVGLMLILLELARYASVATTAWIAPDALARPWSLNLTAWFAALVVFVLAEVFREGARLRREAELTI